MEMDDNRLSLLNRARGESTSPGIYLMKDVTALPIYVGKAKNLRNRLTSYFQPAVHEIPRTQMMVNRVHTFDVILTETEAEALILEASLIKKHKPRFNIRLKDDKTYPYLKIQVLDDFPKIEWTRRVLKDGARYFGPFPSAWAARRTMALLNETFKIRDCSDNTFRHRSRPCILHQMDRCSAPCVQRISQSDYQEEISEAVRVLEGKSDKLVEALTSGMNDAALHEEYEIAASFRDQIKNLNLVTQTQGAVEVGSTRNRDVIHLAFKEASGYGTLLKIREGKLIAVQHYSLQNSEHSLDSKEVLSQVLSQHYLSLRNPQGRGGDSEDLVGSDLLPSEVLVPEPPDDLELLEKTLGISIRVAENAVDTQLLNVAQANAQYALEQNEKRSLGHGMAALEEVQESLQLTKLPQRIECYDISNILGQDAVASRVVFVDGAADKNLYRRYKIRTVEGANDFAMMKEVLGRRFSNTDEDLPDLVVVDGGKGQLSQAVCIFEELGIQGVGIVGLAKARTESDYQAQEVRSSDERIFIPNRKNPVHLAPHTEAYKLLTHVRNEAHRFAISYHRILRDKRALKRSK